jgi:acetyl esterase/lipase
MNANNPSKSVRVPYGPEPEQFGDLYVPQERSGPHPTIILIHGGFWRAHYGLELMTDLANDLIARGLAVWNIEYRRVGNQGGWPNTLLDVAAAADHLRALAPRYALDLTRVISMGHSAGGHLALWLAGRPRIPQDSPIAPAEDQPPLPLAGAISLAGAVDLVLSWTLKLGNNAAGDFLGGTPTEVPERYAAASPASLLPLGVPQALVHGTEDDTVPLRVSQEYLQAALEAGDQVQLDELEGVDHFALIDPHTAAWTRTIEALEEVLAAASAPGSAGD